MILMDPDTLYKVKYEPKGHPELAKEVKDLAPKYLFMKITEWGLITVPGLF